jgi:hypothetical protein
MKPPSTGKRPAETIGATTAAHAASVASVKGPAHVYLSSVLTASRASIQTASRPLAIIAAATSWLLNSSPVAAMMSSAPGSTSR